MSLRIPVPNPLLVKVSISAMLLRGGQPEISGTESRVTAKAILSFLIESMMCILVAWSLVNLSADWGLKLTSTRSSHMDWSLQTKDILVNLLIIGTCIVGQLFRFTLNCLSDKDARERFSKGKFFYLPLVCVIGGLLGIFVRLSVIPTTSYDLYIPNATIFALIWIPLSIFLFVGYLGFWKLLFTTLFSRKQR